ncbi:MAG TPA: phosphatidate cytidylyltransferase [Gammaproteobacteria bacterium]|nr:phosphatidate cytidylyltransferase [Gammaproteobacteria bacterium]
MSRRLARPWPGTPGVSGVSAAPVTRCSATGSVSPVPRTRLLTALALLVLALALVWYGDLPWLAGVLALIALRAAWEWGQLCPGLDGAWRGGVLLALGALLAATYVLPPALGSVLWSLALVGWLLALVLVVRYPAVPSVLQRPLVQAAIIVLALAAAWSALVRLAQIDRSLLLVCLALVWVADSVAYLVGRRYGRRRLCPQVSPGKTLAGLYGGLAGAVLVGLLAGAIWRLDAVQVLALGTLAALCAALSVVGDLTESVFKRRAGVKDSGQLLPGHGGALDRIDALIAAAPLFALLAPSLVGG